MKSIKNIFVTIVSAIAFFTTQSSVAGTSGLLKSIQGPGFELYNKAPQTISVGLVINGKLVDSKSVGAGQKFLKDIDTKGTVRIGIFNTPPKNISADLSSANAIYEINASGKTKYVTWNPAKAPYLYPQTGPLMGLANLVGMGKTESGYTLNDNIQQSQITKK
jgi:hypothetical protein